MRGAIITSVFCIAAIVFWSCPTLPMSDSACSLLSSETLLTRGTLQLNEYSELPGGGPITWEGHDTRGRIFYLFPPGPVVLSLPAVALARTIGWSTINNDNEWNYHAEQRLQRLLAVILSALTVVCLFGVANTYLSLRSSVAVAIAVGLGTQIFTLTSRSLWSQTWSLFLVSLALLVLARLKDKLGAAALATLLSWAFFCRPSAAIPIICIAVYLLIYHRRLFFVYAAVGLAWGIAFVLWSITYYDRLLPMYYCQLWPDFDPDEPEVFFGWFRITGNLFSLTHGLIPCVPLSLVAMWLGLKRHPLCIMCYAWIILQFTLLGWFEPWTGGIEGARLTADLIPCLTLLAVVGMGLTNEKESV